jgi:hypothetical protein
MTSPVSDDPGRVPRLTFASAPADPADYLPPEPATGTRFMLRLTPNGAPPLDSSLAALDRALVIFTIGPETTAEHIAEHIITALNLNGRVHVMLEPLPTGAEE